MAGMRLDPICFEPARFVEVSGSLSRNALALLATVIAFGVSGAFLLSLVPDASEPAGFEPTLAFAGAAAALPREPAPRPPPSRRFRGPRRCGSKRTAVARDLPLPRVCAIRANAHYTYVHDGETEYFCNRSISALETMLDPALLCASIAAISSAWPPSAKLRRHGDAAMLDVGAPVQCSIPVAPGAAFAT